MEREKRIANLRLICRMARHMLRSASTRDVYRAEIAGRYYLAKEELRGFGIYV
jgi:hypothetical protein